MALQQIDVLLAGVRDSSGNILAGGKIYTYDAGTLVNKATYQDSAGATPEANPIILDGAGRKLAYADGAYKFIVKDAADATVYTWDNLYFSRVTSSASSTNADFYGGTSSGAAGAYAITVAASLTSLSAGHEFSFIANHTQTGASTLNVNGLGAISIVWGDTPFALTTDVIRSGDLVTVTYDTGGGGRFRVQNIRAGNLTDNCNIYGGTTGGTSTAYTATARPTISGYKAGQVFKVRLHTACGASPTINFSSLGAKSIINLKASAVGANELLDEQLELIYDGSNMVVTSPDISGLVTWAPTLGGVGTITWAGVASYAKYTRRGKQIHFALAASATSGGSSDTYLSFTLPVTAVGTSFAFSGSGVNSASEIGVTGYMNSTTTVYVYRTQSGTWTSGATNSFKIQGWYEAA